MRDPTIPWGPYTDLCSVTTSVWNLLGRMSDVYEVGRDELLSLFIQNICIYNTCALHAND